MEEAGVEGLRWTADQAAPLECQHLFLGVGRGKPSRRLEPGDRLIAVKNEHGAAMADGVEEGAQVVFRFCNTSYFHMANLAMCSVIVNFLLIIGGAVKSLVGRTIPCEPPLSRLPLGRANNPL